MICEETEMVDAQMQARFLAAKDGAEQKELFIAQLAKMTQELDGQVNHLKATVKQVYKRLSEIALVPFSSAIVELLNQAAEAARTNVNLNESVKKAELQFIGEQVSMIEQLDSVVKETGVSFLHKK